MWRRSTAATRRPVPFTLIKCHKTGNLEQNELFLLLTAAVVKSVREISQTVAPLSCFRTEPWQKK